MDSEDKLTVVFSGSLKDKCLYQVLGFESGKIVVIPFFIDSGKRDLTFYLGGIGNSQIKAFEIVGGYLIISSDDGSINVISFSQVNALKTPECPEIVIDETLTLSVQQIDPKFVKNIDLGFGVKKLLPVVSTTCANEKYLQNFKRYDEFFVDTIGIVLESDAVALLSLSNKITLFEYRLVSSDVVGIFYDMMHQFLILMYSDGMLDVFNANIGNVMALMSTRWQILSVSNSQQNQDVLFELKFLIAEQFCYERTLNLQNHHFNLVDLLEQYRNCYIDLQSYSKYCASALMNLTVSGEIAEYSTQFYHNPLLATHIELITFSKALKMKKPQSLSSENHSITSSPQKQRREIPDDLSGFQSLNDLKKQLDSIQRQHEMEAKEQEFIGPQKLHIMMQNIVERDKFSYARAKLGEKPLQLLSDFQESNTVHFEDVAELIQVIKTLNYSGKQILVDSESESCNQIMKVSIKKTAFNIMLVSPPSFNAASMNKKLILTSLVFPFGIDTSSDEDVKKAMVSQTSILDIVPGVKGVSDTMSFRLTPNLLQIQSEELADSKAPEPVLVAQVNCLNKSLYFLSPFQSSNYMLGVICEVIFIFKKSNLNLAPLMNALKSIYFSKLPKETGFKPFSFKILSLLALNDRLLISAGAHFIINNIYAEIKDDEVLKIDPETAEFCSHFFLRGSENPSNPNQPQISSNESSQLLNMISKFELFATSLLLVEIRNKNSSLVGSTNIASFSHAIIIKLISRSIE